ncbi:MAG: TusE/DsrC/DsvC family sulfur relay protein [bacterium]
MNKLTFRDKDYEVDAQGFLSDPQLWDDEFAVGMAPILGIRHGLTSEHWKVIRFIRKTYEELGRCPLVYQTCKLNGLLLRHLQRLFPTGYLRGACKLAGVTFREEITARSSSAVREEHSGEPDPDKRYEVDVRGFLVDHRDWDEEFAVNKCFEMKMPEGLTEQHWQLIYYLREYFIKTNEVPTVYETCRANSIELEELEELFPDGYHRGAVKLAGLRER